MHVHIKIHIFCFDQGSKLMCGLVSKFKQQYTQASALNGLCFFLIDNITGFFSKKNMKNLEVGGHIISISNIDLK